MPYRVLDRDMLRPPLEFVDVVEAVRTARAWRADGLVVFVEEIGPGDAAPKLIMTFGTGHTRSFSGFG
jgi:hypothetical protein